MRRSLKDRFLTPVVARAMMSPLGIMLFGGATAAGIAGGLPIAGAVGVGIVAWLARVGIAIPRNSGASADRVDPFVLSEPWRGYVQGAQNAKQRYDRVVASTAPGPIRDRLADLGGRLDDGIADCWRIATRGDTIDDAQRQLRTAEAQLELTEARRQQRDQGNSVALESTIRSLEAQLQSSERMHAVSADARDKLRLLDARLDELVARAVEVSVGSGDSGALSGDVDDIVNDLEALRQALEDTEHAAAGTSDTDVPLPSAAPPAEGPVGTTEPSGLPQPESRTWPPSG
jgi:hypothetical protein